MQTLAKYLRLQGAFMRYSLTREMMFKTNFVLWIIVDFIWFGAQILFINVLFYQVKEVADWTKYQMIMLYGTAHLIQQIFSCFFMTNCTEIPELVRTGRLDFIMLLPANSQYLVSTQKFDPGALINSLIGVFFVVYAAWKMALVPTFMQIALYLVLLVAGVVIHYSLLMLIVTLSFWIVRAQGLVYGYYNLFQIARLPREVFPLLPRIIFTFVLPMLIVANVPAKALGRVFDFRWAELGLAFGLAALFLLATRAFWNFALRYYTSASS